MSKKKIPTKPVRPVVPPSVKKKPVATAVPVVNRVPVLPGSWLLGLLAAGLGLVLYVNTFGHQYTLDDFSAIKENWVVKGGLKNLGIIFSTEYRYGAWSSPGSLYRPFSLAMFALEWQLSPDKPFLSHFMNVVLYALSGYVLWITWRRILVNYPPVLPALAVLLFMAHPVHTEVVANIKSRDEILALLLSTVALYGIWKYFGQRSTGWLVAALVAYGVGLFSKESAITFLAIFPLTIWFFTDRPLAENLKVSALFLIPAGIFLLARGHAIGAQENKEVFSILDNFIVGAKNPGERFGSAFMMCWKYLQTLLFPHPLVSDLGYPQTKLVGFGHWKALLGFFTFGSMFVWALLNLGRKHFMSFAILLFLSSFSLFSNVLMLIGTSYGERLLYVPSLGFAFGVAYLLMKAFKINDFNQIWNPNGKGAWVWGIAGAVLLLYCLKTVTRNAAWYDSSSLYEADIPNSPNCAKLNYHYGLEVTKRGMDEKKGVVTDKAQVEKGIAQYTRTLELYPEYHDAYGSRGVAYFRLAQYDKAAADYQKALKYRPNDAKVLSNMGFIYFLKAQRPGGVLDAALLDSAETVYRESLKYDPRFVDARRNLGAVMAMKKNFPAAIEQWKEGLKYDPNNATLLYYIGSGYYDMGDKAQAQPWLEKAYAADPTLPRKQ